MSKQKLFVGASVLIVGTLALSACGVDSGSAGSDGEKVLTVMTHDSFAVPEDLIAQFEKESGYSVTIAASGDAGEVTNKLILSKDAPTADVIFGIDNTFGMRAVDAGVLEPYAADLAAEAKQFVLPDSKDELTPIDYGDVCVNVDNAWFAANNLAAPTSLDDLIKPEYKDLFVTPSAATSSPGMAFFLATVAKYGEDGWQSYWSSLMANGAKLTSGWTDAYSVDFSAGEGKGSRPIVLSYASSPPFTIPEGASEPTTAAVLSTCFRQIEYAGVVAGTEHADAAHQFIDFLGSEAVQTSIPDNMYMYPVRDVPLPQVWEQFAPLSTEPLVVDAATIAANRDAWLKEWADVTAG